MSKDEIKAGASIQSKCTKCKEATRHVIVAVADGKPVKVQCVVCEGQHLYRSPVEPSKPAAKKPTRPRRKETTASASKNTRLWQEQLAGRDEAAAVPYAIAGSFNKNSLINHKKFGLGVVERLIDPNKMDVIFEDGLKTLVRGQ